MKKSSRRLLYAAGGYVIGAYIWNNWFSGYAPKGGLTGINVGLPLDILSNFNFGVIPTRVMIPMQGAFALGQPPMGLALPAP